MLTSLLELKFGGERYRTKVSPRAISGSCEALVIFHVICYGEKEMSHVSWITYICLPHHISLNT